MTKKASRALELVLRTKPEQIADTWRQQLEAEQRRPSAPQPSPEPMKPALLGSREIAGSLLQTSIQQGAMAGCQEVSPERLSEARTPWRRR